MTEIERLQIGITAKAELVRDIAGDLVEAAQRASCGRGDVASVSAHAEHMAGMLARLNAQAGELAAAMLVAETAGESAKETRL